MKIIIAGKSDIASLALIYLKINTNYKIVAVPSKSDLKEHSWQMSLSQTARELGIETSKNIDNFLVDDNIIFSLEYDKIIKINENNKNEIFNIHFSLLPKYKGVYTSIFPILNNEKSSGVTLHKIDEGIDTGEIVDQIQFNIENDTAYDLYKKYNYYGFELFKRNIDSIINKNYNSFKQSKAGSSYFSRKDLDFTKRIITKKDLYSKNANEIHNILRAFYFPVYQYPIFENRIIEQFKLIDSIHINYEQEIINLNENKKILKTKKGSILVDLGGQFE